MNYKEYYCQLTKPVIDFCTLRIRLFPILLCFFFKVQHLQLLHQCAWMKLPEMLLILIKNHIMRHSLNALEFRAHCVVLGILFQRLDLYLQVDRRDLIFQQLSSLVLFCRSALDCLLKPLEVHKIWI